MARVKVMRIICYEGDKEWVERVLERSLQDGDHLLGGTRGTISIRSINESEIPIGLQDVRMYAEHFRKVDENSIKEGDTLQ